MMHSACSSCVLKARKLLDILAARGAAKGASRGVHIRWETLQLCVVTNILGYTTDRRTDRRTAFSSLYRVCIQCSAVIKHPFFTRTYPSAQKIVYSLRSSKHSKSPMEWLEWSPFLTYSTLQRLLLTSMHWISCICYVFVCICHKLY